MSVIRLLVLGAVRQHGRAHGYQVRGDLEYWGAHEWSNAKPGSIYHALKQLAKQGLLTAHESAPSVAGGPPRTEYGITEAGTAEYFALLRAALTAYDEKPDLLSAALGFMVDLPRAEVVELLGRRLAAIAAWRSAVTGDYLPQEGTPEAAYGHIGEIMRHWLHSADADARWTRGLVERVASGAYVFEGEGEGEGERECGEDGDDGDDGDEDGGGGEAAGPSPGLLSGGSRWPGPGPGPG